MGRAVRWSAALARLPPIGRCAHRRLAERARVRQPGDVLVLGGVVDHTEHRVRLPETRGGAPRDGFGPKKRCERGSNRALALAGHVRVAKNAHLPCLRRWRRLVGVPPVARRR